MEKIMIVDDNMANLIMARKALEDIYEVIPVSSGISALECLKDMPELPILVLLDIDMPNVNGFQVISELKNHERTANLPIIFLTAQDDDVTEVEGYNLGGVDYIKKPYSANVLRKRVDLQMQLLEQKKELKEYTDNLAQAMKESARKHIELQNSVVEMFVDMLEKRNSFWGQHAKRVERDMRIFIKALCDAKIFELSSDECKMLIFASKVHDIGKICLPDSVFEENGGNRNGKLRTFFNQHTTIGADTVTKLSRLSGNSNNFVTYAFNMCRFHHECWDGKGFPDRLSKESIPIEARILAIVNAYDNLRYANLSGKMLSHNEAILELKNQKGKMYDPKLVDEFVKAEKEIAATNP